MKTFAFLLCSLFLVASDAALVEAARPLKEQMTNSVWTFPWGGKPRSIELKENGELILGWHRSARGYKWRVSGDRTIELFVYMDRQTFDTMRLAKNGQSAALIRDGKPIAIILRKTS